MISEKTPSLMRVFNISGMWCASCAKSIEKKVSNIPSVYYAKVDFATSQLLIKFRGDMNLLEIQSSIADLGYRISDIFSDIYSSEEKNIAKSYLINLALVAFFSMWSMLASISFYVEGSNQFMLTLSAIFSAPAFILGIWPFAKMAFLALRAKTLTFDLLIVIANTLLMIISIHALIRNESRIYFETVGMTLTIILGSRFLDAYLRNNLRLEVYELFQKSTGLSFVYIDNKWISAPAQNIKQGKIIRIKSGESLYHDAKIIKGNIWVNTSQVNGESNPVYRSLDETVHAGETIIEGDCEAVVLEPIGTRWIDKYVFSFLTTLNHKGQKSTFEKLMDFWVPIVLLSSLVIFVCELLLGSSYWDSLATSATLLLISCPCVLVLIQPLSRLIAKQKLFNKNIMLKRSTDWGPYPPRTDLFFDKTGTLTSVDFSKPKVISLGGFDHANLDFLLASASWGLESPYSGSILKNYDGSIERSGFRRVLPGVGILWVRSNGQKIEVRKINRKLEKDYLKFQSLIVVDDNPVGGIIYEQIILPGSISTLTKLKTMGYNLHLISGDIKENADKLISYNLFKNVYFEKSPEDKREIVEAARKMGRDVIFIGDGLNDIQAMAASNLSIGISSKNRANDLLSDITIERDNFFNIVYVLKTLSLMKMRSRWALTFGLLFNVAAIFMILMDVLHPLAIVALMSSVTALIILTLKADFKYEFKNDNPVQSRKLTLVD